jgi:hypothetical protein
MAGAITLGEHELVRRSSAQASKRWDDMKIPGIMLIILALTIAIVPQFTDCEARGRSIVLPNGAMIPMRCHWTARAEIATAVPLVAVGGMIAATGRQRTIRALAAVGMLLGTMSLLLPASLIGVCPNPDMLCNMVMRPALMFAGVLTVAVSLVALLGGTQTEQSRSEVTK